MMNRRAIQFGRQSSNGFTLVEMLIVITILLVLMTVTVLSVNYVQDSERVSGAARQVQSFIAGARDRAIFLKRPIGVRFFLDADTEFSPAAGERRTVSAMAYVDGGTLWTGEENVHSPIEIRRWDPDLNNVTNIPSGGIDINGDGIEDDPRARWMVVAPRAHRWWELKRRGLLIDGARIQIPAGSDEWYHVDTRFIDITAPPGPQQILVLRRPMPRTGTGNWRNSKTGQEIYELELPPTLMPAQPSILPEDVVIDLDGSRVPVSWRPVPPSLNFHPYLDLMFSPRGTVTGSAASAGIVHLYVSDKTDSTTLKDAYIDSLNPTRATAIALFESVVASGTPFIPGSEIDPSTNAWVAPLDAEEPYLLSERRLVSTFTQTGRVTIHPVNPTDSDSDGFADAPFLFAETGEEAN